MTDLNPNLVVISNGSVGDYRHPRAVTLRAYAAIPGPPMVLQTNNCFYPHPCANVPDQFIADPDPGDDDGTIRVTVDIGARTHTVAWTASSRTFNVKTLPAVALIITVVIESLLPNPV